MERRTKGKKKRGKMAPRLFFSLFSSSLKVPLDYARKKRELAKSMFKASVY